MGNKHTGSSSRQTLQYQTSVPANPVSIVVPNPQPRRRCSEFKYKSVEATDRPSINPNPPNGDAAAKLNRQRRWSTAAAIGTARNNTMKPKRLAPRQRNLIIKSWNKTAKTKVGKDIFVGK
uniref:Uncharacterized protein n=1 Tax=Panagrolaimus sp. PS1159 TaxID=55785 RepID=A0AC35EV77_9BILA